MIKASVNVGTRYGLLTISGECDSHVSPSGSRRRVVECQCDCGRITKVWLSHLKSGNTVSCGCKKRMPTHGMTGSRTYMAWACMKDRCHNPNSQSFLHYGQRGIAVCDRWMESFEAFFDDMGECPRGMSLDRFPNNDGNYEPENCRWATPPQQNRNTRRTRFVTWNGETLCIADWATRTGIHKATLRARLESGWSIEAALTKSRKELK